MKCVSYIRYSSCLPETETPKDILKQQSDRIQKLIKEQGWELTEKYVDRKRNSEAEDAFREMLADGIARKFEMVVTDSAFRCGKNVSFAEDVLLKTFFPAGIHFCILEDNVCSLSMSFDQLAEYFKKKRNQWFGSTMTEWNREKQAAGYFSVHDEKFGYLLTEDHKGFVVDEEAAAVVREIFYLLGEKEMTYKAVSDLMNEKGIISPMAHLARVGQKKRVGIESKWVSCAVKRIAENTAYIGYWYKMVAGERTKIAVPPIIEQKLFEKVRERYSRTPTKNAPRLERSKNVFIKHIVDKETRSVLLCRLHRTERPYQTFAIGFWDKETILYDDVMRGAVRELRRERESALLAKKIVNTESAKQEFERRKSLIAKEAKRLFAEMSAIEEGHIPAYCQMRNGEISEAEYQSCRAEIFSRLQEKENKFAKLMETLDELETAFSNRNPWIQFYSKIQVPDELSNAQVRKWIDKVLVSHLEWVEISIPEKYQRWKDLLPQEWLEE